MTDIFTGFLIGLGGMLGVVTGGLLCLGVWFVGKMLVLRRRTMRKMPKLILKYRTVLIALEKFEELMLIDRFLERLKRNEMPRELSLRYSVKYLKNAIRQYEEA